MMEDALWRKTTYDGRRLIMKDDNEDDLKEDLHIGGMHTALDNILLCGIFFSSYLVSKGYIFLIFQIFYRNTLPRALKLTSYCKNVILYFYALLAQKLTIQRTFQGIPYLIEPQQFLNFLAPEKFSLIIF